MFDFDELDDSSPVERVWAISDIHTDCKENFEFIDQLDRRAYQRDVLLVAGDVSDDLLVVQRTFQSLRPKFAAVFFVPGNHDLWVASGPRATPSASRVTPGAPPTVCGDSLEKLVALEQLCADCRVETRPRRVSTRGPDGDTAGPDLWIVPLLSWHCQSFDTEMDIDARWRGIPKVEEVCSDYLRCRWPFPLDHRNDSIAKRLEAMNDERLAEVVEVLLEARDRMESCLVLSFSHFLPRIELLPEKRYLYFPALAKMVGSPYLGQRVQQLASDVHVFGHTHFGWDQEIDGIRYILAPMGMPRERDQRLSTVATGDFLEAAAGNAERSASPLLVWDRCNGLASKYAAAWSAFYEEYTREPDQVTVLPEYVAELYEWDEATHGSRAMTVGWEGKTPAWKFGPAWTQERKRHH